ncbi:Ankyrin repeat-containing protein [Artemisia annua]|uniref:Ankyrin repeat-containing protein n=1 Tax=Artemisia annua TaxID=35608 RepID=A0A2U1LCA0_ARTAN|nr:Ankyrin repeat-containing protein [Artemisia annua]
MTKITDVEASLEQFKSDSLANQVETSNRFDRMQESIDKNKAEADKQFMELLQHLKALQPPATTLPSLSYPATLRPHQSIIETPPSNPFTLPISAQNQYHDTYSPFSVQPSATYTSFSGLQFDSQGFPLRLSQPGDDIGNRNSQPLITTDRIFQNSQGNTYGQVGGAFPHVAIHGPGRGWHPGSDHRLRKLKMPLFDGEDVYGWVYQAERFFEVQGLITPGERLRAAVLSLEGSALSWFRWINNREPFISWEELKRRLLHRFQSSQEGTAREYVTLFERMAAQLPGLSEEVLEGIFIKGLKPELRTAVRTHQPSNLSQAMDLTLLIDESRTGATPKPATNRVGVVSSRPQLAPTGGGTKEKQNGGHRVTEDFYSLELGSTDVILGMKWLRQLGETRVNWKELTMSFQRGVDRITLRGEPGLRRAEASLRSLARAIPDISETYLISLTRVEDTSTMVTPAVRDDSEIMELRTRLLNGEDGLEGYEIYPSHVLLAHEDDVEFSIRSNSTSSAFQRDSLYVILHRTQKWRSCP